MAESISRRSVVAGAGGMLVGGALGACTRDHNRTGAQRTPTTATAPSEQEIKMQVAAENHGGSFAGSISEAEVTEESYLSALAQEARTFQCSGQALDLDLMSGSERDVGGGYANEILLSAVASASSADRVARFVSESVGDSSLKRGLVAFGYHRFLDTGASREYGAPVFGHRSQAIYFPNTDLYRLIELGRATR